MDIKTGFDSRRVLELACSAQRYNNSYVKYGTQQVDQHDPEKIIITHDNKSLIRNALGLECHSLIPLIKITTEDRKLADDITNYFKRLIFAAIEGENEFQTTVYELLNSGKVQSNQFGYIACLPSVYARELEKKNFKQQCKTFDDAYLAPIGSKIVNRNCEILNVTKSKNYDSMWNVTGVIDNKLVSWMSKSDMILGGCVISRANIKDHSTRWDTNAMVTRLHYVKVDG